MRPGSGAPDPVPSELDLSRVPTHVGCVMDGNGRWAAAHGVDVAERVVFVLTREDARHRPYARHAIVSSGRPAVDAGYVAA